MQFDYFVPFPLSLIVSRKAIFRYQLLFRHLFSLKYVETLLNDAWIEQNKVSIWLKPSPNRRVEKWKARAWVLRARMLSFVQQIHYYCTNEVIERQCNALLVALDRVDTVDQLMQDHIDFLDTCLKECMLTNSRLLKVYSKLLKTCQAFAVYVHTLSKYLMSLEKESESDIEPRKLDLLDKKLGDYEVVFERTLKVLLDTLNYYASTETISLLSLMVCLDCAILG